MWIGLDFDWILRRENDDFGDKCWIGGGGKCDLMGD